MLQGRCDLVFEVVKSRCIETIDSSHESNAELMR